MNKKIIYIALIIVGIIGCSNPFSPRRGTNSSDNDILTDQKTIEGVFKNFQYSYSFKDTLVYGNLLDKDFKFSYTNINRGDYPTWGRETDMYKTYLLFESTYKIELLWNDSWSEFEYEDNNMFYATVNRRFTLTVYYSPTVFDYVYGNAFFILRRESDQNPWKIILWEDQSA